MLTTSNVTLSQLTQATDNLCSKISRGLHHGHRTTSYETQIICLSSSYPPEQWFFHVQRLCIATSLFQQDVSLLSSKDPHYSSPGRNICKDSYAVTSQHPGFSNIVGDYCLFIFIAFSCYGIFRPCHKLISLPGHIASSYSNSHKLTTKVSHTSPFFFWWNIFPPIVQKMCTLVSLPAQNFFLPFTLCNYLSQAALSSAATPRAENLTKHHWRTASSSVNSS